MGLNSYSVIYHPSKRYSSSMKRKIQGNGHGPCGGKEPLNHVDHLAIPPKLTNGRFLEFMRMTLHSDTEKSYKKLRMHGEPSDRHPDPQEAQALDSSKMSIDFIKQCSD